MRPWQCFEPSQLPAHVKTALQNSRDLWQFLDDKNSEENATTVAKHLWKIFAAAAAAANNCGPRSFGRESWIQSLLLVSAAYVLQAMENSRTNVGLVLLHWFHLQQ